MKTILIASILFSAATAFAQKTELPGCSKYIQGFAIWEDEEDDGRIVKHHDVRPMQDWDPNGNLFRGIVIVGKLPAGVKKPVLEMEYTPDAGGKSVKAQYKILLPFSRDPKLMQFDEFDARDFFNFHSGGKYTARLKHGDKTLCQETHNYGASE